MAECLLSTAETAELLGITDRAVRKNALSGKYGEVRYTESPSRGGRNGKVLRISLSSLPITAQEAYAKKYHLHKNPEHIEVNEYDLAPEWQREIANQRYQILKQYESYIRQPGKKTELTDYFVSAWNGAHPEDTISRATLYNYQKKYREKGMAGLLTGYGKREEQRDIDEAALACFHGLFLRDSRPSVADAYFTLVLEAKRNGWKIPSLRTMQRIAKEDIPAGVSTLLREGEKAYYDNIQTFTRRDPESIQAGQIYVGDHYRFDFFIRHGESWVRPWLTAWLDMRSHKLVGWSINLTPKVDTIVAAFAEAALDPAIGLPRDIYIDNGRDYCSWRFAGRGARGKKLTDDDKEELKKEGKQVESMMDRLKITTHFAIVENARAKVIEREFKNIVEWFSKHMDMYCGRNPKERPEGIKEKLKNEKAYGLTLEKLRSVFSEWARYVFNKRVSQKGKGREGECPDETWNRTRLPVRTAEISVMRLLFMQQTNPFKVGRNGITFNGREYYFADPLSYKGKHVYIRYRQEYPETIWLYDMDNAYIGEASLLESTLAINESSERIKQENSRKKAEKQAIRNHQAYKNAKNADPIDIERITELQKIYGNIAPDPERTKVTEMVFVSGNDRESAQLMKATGTDNASPMNVFEMVQGVKIEKRKGDI